VAPGSEAEKLVGTWQARITEFGSQKRIFWYVRKDGTSYFQFSSPNGTGELAGTWQYSAGVLSERYANGISGKGAIKWIDMNHIEVTILDNGNPAYTGLKRHYYRQ
jgi:hypothetical protein